MTPDNKQTTLLRWLLPFVCSIVLVMMHPHVLASSLVGKTVSPPPSVELDYVVRANYTAMSIGGSSHITWKQAGNEYAIKSSARGNLVGLLLETSSKGLVDTKGLKPTLFTEKRRNRDETSTVFNHHSRTLTFTDSKESHAFDEGTQDQSSIVWQLASIARAHPEKFTEGNKLTFMVSGRNRIDRWDFIIGKESTLLTSLGEIKVVHLTRTDKKGKTTEVWLAPDKEWYPVKLVFLDTKGLRLEQTIKKITPG